MSPLIRPAVQILAGLATAIGIVPNDVSEFIVANAETVAGSLLTIWGVVAAFRNRKAAQAA